jgi:hypothetical protein
METPPLARSIRLALPAVGREAWLLPVSMLVSLARSAAVVPGLAVAVFLPIQGALEAARSRPLSPWAPIEGGSAVFTSARYFALVGGLWLAGALLAGALRVLFLAGALPTLGARLAGVDSARRFAPGVASGFPRQLGTWILAALVELAAFGYALTVGMAAVLAWGGILPLRHPIWMAWATASILTVALGGLLVARVLGDAAAARTAILGERPGEAFAGATRRYLARPGAFTLGGVAALLAGIAATMALQPAAGVVAAIAQRVDATIVMGPQLMVAVIAALLAAAVDLAWLATVSVLACSGEGPSGG